MEVVIGVQDIPLWCFVELFRLVIVLCLLRIVGSSGINAAVSLISVDGLIVLFWIGLITVSIFASYLGKSLVIILVSHSIASINKI